MASRGRGASRGRKQTPAWIWLITGFLIGLGLAWYLFAKGLVPQTRGAGSQTPAESSGADSGTAVEEVAPRTRDSKRSQYDFFTVLPEMEVVVPEQELSENVQPGPAGAAAPDSTGSYLLQVGSFREMSDAEQMKAQLALLGIVARVQTVTVNDATWHRVRAGPVASAREADDMRTRLAENGIDSLVLKNQ